MKQGSIKFVHLLFYLVCLNAAKHNNTKDKINSFLNFQAHISCACFVSVLVQDKANLKGHCHEHNFKNSTALKHVYIIGNLLTVVNFS